MKNINGLTITLNKEAMETKEYFIGFDEEGFLFIENEYGEVSFNEDQHEIFYEFVNKMIKEIRILDWKRYYEGDIKALSFDWKVVIHYQDIDDKMFQGKNATPSNFNEFLKLCVEYGIIEVYEDKEVDTSKNLEWYNDFLVEIYDLESTLKCPHCDSDQVVHVNPIGYDFLCADCGENFDYEEGKYVEYFLFEED